MIRLSEKITDTLSALRENFQVFGEREYSNRERNNIKKYEVTLK